MKLFRRSNRREDKELKHEYEFQGSCVLRDTSKLVEKAGTVSFFRIFVIQAIHVCISNNFLTAHDRYESLNDLFTRVPPGYIYIYIYTHTHVCPEFACYYLILIIKALY